MRRKIIWITFWTTMAYWLGGAWGCATDTDPGTGKGEQNYKVLEEDTPRYDPNYHGSLPPDRAVFSLIGIASAAEETPIVGSTTTAESAPASDTERSIVPTTQTSLTPATAPTTQPSPDLSTEPVAPSLNGLDRSHWQTISVAPVDGSTKHFPVYFHDRNIDKKKKRLDRIPDTEGQLKAALNYGRYDLFGGKNFLNGVLQPVKYGADLALLPVLMFQTPPWDTEVSRAR